MAGVKKAFDLLVIGGGSGGLGMARRAAEFGVKVTHHISSSSTRQESTASPRFLSFFASSPRPPRAHADTLGPQL